VTTPLPAGDFATVQLPTVEIPAGRELFRMYDLRFEPVFYDRSSEGRLNAPDATYGVLYCAERPDGAFAETFLRRASRNQLALDVIAQRGMVTLVASAPLRLATLHGPGLARMGATAEIAHGGKPYEAPQAWSRAIHGHPDQVDGIAYHARHDDQELCYAIFDRAGNRLAESSRETNLNQDWFFGIADRYGVGLAPEQ
jgi:hypothetical protein